MKFLYLLTAACGVLLVGGCVSSGGRLIDADSFTHRPDSDRNRLLDGVGELSLDKAREIALINNPTFRAAQQGVNAARMRYYQALGAYSPVISAASAVGQQLFDGSDSNQNNSKSNAFYSYSMVQASWTVFDGLAREFAVLSARHSEKMMEHLSENSARLLLRGISYAYNDILLADEQERISRNDFEFQTLMLAEAEAGYKAGTTSRATVLNFKGLADQARANMVTAAYQSKIARFALAVQLGCDDGELPPEITFPALRDNFDRMEALSVDLCLDSALANRPDLNAYREQLKIVEYDLYTSYSAFSPTISAFANYSYSSNSTHNSGNNANGFANFYVQGNSFNYGGVASWTVFNGAIRYNQMREAKVNLRIAELKGAEEWLTVVRDVRGAYENLRQNLTLAEIKRDMVSNNLEQRDIVAQEYRVGSTQLTRLNEAQKNFRDSSSALASALADIAKARAQLDAAAMIGSEAPEKLKETGK